MSTFSVDDVVRYGANGCCRIDAIEERDTGTYYVLRPINKDRTKYLVPTDNDELVARMHPIPSTKALDKLLDRVERAELYWVEDAAERKEEAKRVISQGAEYDVRLLVRSFLAHREQTLAAGKKVSSADQSVLRSAQDYVRDEFSVAYGIQPEDVDDLIMARIAKMA